MAWVGTKAEVEVEDVVVIAQATRHNGEIRGRVTAIDSHVRIVADRTGHEVTVARARLYWEPLAQAWRVG